MRKRKRLYDKYKRSRNITDFEIYKNIFNKVTFEIRKSKKCQIEKLSEKLKSNEIDQKDWWKTLKIIHYIRAAINFSSTLQR